MRLKPIITGTLILLAMLTTGCTKINNPYQRAATAYAVDICGGVVQGEIYHPTFPVINSHSLMVESDLSFNYTCVDAEGSKRVEATYKEIPVKYFEGGETYEQ